MVSCSDSQSPAGGGAERKTVWHLQSELARASSQSCTGAEQLQFRRLAPGAPLVNSSVVLNVGGSGVGAGLVVRVVTARKKNNHSGHGNKAEQAVLGGISTVIKQATSSPSRETDEAAEEDRRRADV